MRPAVLIAVASAVAATFSLSSGAPLCTAEQKKAAVSASSRRVCTMQVYDFGVCDDECLATLTKDKASEPECANNVGDTKTLASEAARYLYDCTKARADTSEKYMPRTVSGVAECTKTQTDAWDDKFGIPTAYGDCRRSIGEGCTPECLAKLEEAVLQAPACSERGFWVGEQEKESVWKCLKKRGESISTNKAMLTLPTADGTLKVVEISASSKAATSTTTTKPPTAAATSAGAATTSAVVASVLAISGSVAVTLMF